MIPACRSFPYFCHTNFKCQLLNRQKTQRTLPANEKTLLQLSLEIIQYYLATALEGIQYLLANVKRLLAIFGQFSKILFAILWKKTTLGTPARVHRILPEMLHQHSKEQSSYKNSEVFF
jgi:hypothetical protein